MQASNGNQKNREKGEIQKKLWYIHTTKNHEAIKKIHDQSVYTDIFSYMKWEKVNIA